MPVGFGMSSVAVAILRGMIESPSAGLSEIEVEELAERLNAIGNPAALSLEAVDGFFCALIASPTLVPPSEYLPVILGDEAGSAPAFPDGDSANATMSLLMRYWNSIVADFERDAIHPPYLVDVEPAAIPGRDWARGFLRGARLAGDGWRELWNKEDEGQLLTIPIVAGEVDPDWPTEPLTKERSDEVLELMIAGAGRAYRHFAEARRGSVEPMEFGDEDVDDEFHPETYVRPEPKVGRNEPCPCGSGKKYKKCCGAAE